VINRRRVVLKSLLFALTGVIGLAAVALVFQDQICRAIVLHLASRVPGLEAKVEGELDLTSEFPFTVGISGVNFEFGGEALSGSQWRIGELHLKLRLLYLLRGALYVEQLAVADVEISIPPMPEPVEDSQTHSTEVRIPFVEELLLERVKVRFHSKRTNRLTNSSLPDSRPAWTQRIG